MRHLIFALLAVVLLTATLGVSPAAAASTCGATYTVQKGDYLNSIAKKCGTTASDILAVNPSIKNWNLIYPGQVLKMPTGEPTVVAGSVYIVKPGDTLSGIAVMFKVTLTNLLKVNPQITNANRIEKGDQIKLPEGAAQVRTVGITPNAGKGGDVITIGVTGFAANSELDIRFGLSESQTESIGKLTTDSHGAVLQKINVPTSAQNGKTYVFVVRATSNTALSAVSNTFSATGTSAGQNVYVVVRGDTLRKIADRFDTTVAAILALNKDIKDPNLIYPGQKITVPTGQSGPAVTLTPNTGTPGSKFSVVADGFPVNTSVDVNVTLQGTSTGIVVDAKTDASGYLKLEVTLPASAKAGEKWVVRVHTTDLVKTIEATSGVFTVK